MSMPRRPAHVDTDFEAFRKDEQTRRAAFRRDAIERLLAFAAADPGSFDARAWARHADLIQGLHRHAWLDESRVLPPDRIVQPGAVSPARIRAIHAELRRGLALIFPVTPSVAARWRLWRPPIKAQRLAILRVRRHLTQMAVASWPDTVWVSIMSLLEEFGPRIRRCEACLEKRLFVKSKRQAYCSARCSQRVRSERWYRTHRRVALDRRHERYKRHVLQGRKGTVARRPRRT